MQIPILTCSLAGETGMEEEGKNGLDGMEVK